RPDRVLAIYSLARPLLRVLLPEAAHRLTLSALAAGLGGTSRTPDPPELRQHVWGLAFPNPIGIAAGFDKDADVPEALLRLGFGFVEVGTVTPRPQPGNPRPRVFRLEADGALINRMGFNSAGLDRVIERMRSRRQIGFAGINIGKNRERAAPTEDYVGGVRGPAPRADSIVGTVSPPTPPGRRDLQPRPILEARVRQVRGARARPGPPPPLLVKIAPDLTAEECADIAAVG